MTVTKCARALALTACLGLMVPGMALSASFNDIASGTKTFTEAAKDVNDISKDNSSETKQAPQAKQAPAKKAPAKKAAPAPTQKTKKQRAPQDDSVRGG